MNNNISIDFSKYRDSDYSFLQKMLYEAVYWRRSDNTPSFDEAMSNPEIAKIADNLGERYGDLCIVARVGKDLAGAVWIRYWTEDNKMRGYIQNDIPVLVIGVDEKYRRMGIGEKLISELVREASKQGFRKISLCVSKDNIAFGLYKKTGFVQYEDIGDSLLMVREM